MLGEVDFLSKGVSGPKGVVEECRCKAFGIS